MSEREALQYDIRFDSQRFSNLYSRGAYAEEIEAQKAYVDRQLKTDVGERLDRAESHYVYELRDRRLYAQGENEPFTDVIGRGIMQRSNGTRENAELIGFKSVESYLGDPLTPDGAMVFNPSPPCGIYEKNYFDVHKKVGNTVHSVRYFSTTSNKEYREKILAINPGYAEVIPENPTDKDFFLNPVFVPNHLGFTPDDLAEFVLGGKRGMDEAEFERTWAEVTWLKTSIINTLVDNPGAISELIKRQKALYAGVKMASEGGYERTFETPLREIDHLAEKNETLGAGGCGSGACSTDVSDLPTSKFDNVDGKGPLSFRCPDCKKINTRELFKYVTNCQHCGSDKVLPKSVRISSG